MRLLCNGDAFAGLARMAQLVATTMADNLRDRLAQLHELVTDQLLEDLQAVPEDPDDFELVAAAQRRQAQARRDALTLLKQNGITAPAVDDTPLARIRDKLDFSSVAQKVVPLRSPASGSSNAG